MAHFIRIVFLSACYALIGFLPAAAQSPALWVGYYLGVHGGFGEAREVSVNSTGDRGTVKGAGISAGLHAGRNWQIGSFVYGLEGDLNFLGPTLDRDDSPVNVVVEKLDFQGSLRARFGYASNGWLIFVTGGYAFGQFEQNLDLISRVPPGRTFAKADDLIHGYTAGAGAERALSQYWTMRLEYIFAQYRAHFDPLQTSPIVRLTAPRDMTLDSHIIRFGINYRFGTN